MRQLHLLGHRARNGLHTALLLGALAALAVIAGLLVGGVLGAALALAVGAFSIGLTGAGGAPWVLRALDARELPPHAAPRLHATVAALARRAGLPRTPELYWIPSPVPNAVSIGSREHARVAVTEGLLRALSERELTAVLAHEIGHVRNGDLAVMAVADGFARITAVAGQLGFGLVLVGACLGAPGVSLGGVVLMAGPPLATLLQLALSRTREHAADLAAVELVDDPEALASALVRIERPAMAWQRWIGLEPGPSLLRTHPDTEARVRRLRTLAPPRAAVW